MQKSINDAAILVVGDIIADQYINCSIERISREAPIPIYNFLSNKFLLGGAGNVVANLVSLGNKVCFIGTKGKDEAGIWIDEEFEKLKVKSLFFANELNQTVTKTRFIVNNHQVSRVDKILTNKNHVDLEKIKFFIKNNNIKKIVLSDYGLNFLSENISRLLIEYANENEIPLLIDPRGKNWNKYQNAWCITPNLEELSEAIGYKVINNDEEVEKAALKLIHDLNVNHIIVTRSEQGISSISKKEIWHKKIEPINVIDVVGAGDVVLAVLTHFAHLNVSWNTFLDAANAMAKICVSHFGVYVISLSELENYLLNQQHTKLFDLQSLKRISKQWKEENKLIVFTNGCFDLVHYGHIYYLYKAKQLGHKLIVGLNSDFSIKKIKGETRPVSNEKSRIAVLSALEMIDAVIVFSEDTPESIIKEIKPHILVKGADWKNKSLPGEKYAEKVEFIDYQENYSTTNLINKIK